MKKFNIFLDSNIIIATQYNFNGGALKSLKHYCDSGEASLYTSDIVIKEVSKHIEEDVQSVARQAKNAIKQGVIRNSLSVDDYKYIETSILSAPQKLLKLFNQYFKNAKKIKYNDISVIEMFDDYFSNKEPFESAKEKKSEFPDAAIIASIKKYMDSQTINGVLYVISNDTGWHKALEGVKNVIVYKTLKEMLDEISKEQEQLYDNIINYATTKIGKIKSNVENWLCDVDWTSVVEDGSCIECDEITDIDVDEIKLKVQSVDYIDNNEGYADVTLSGYADVIVDFSYIDHNDETYDREDKVWYNTKYGNGKAVISIPLELLVCIFLPNEEDDKFSLGDIDYDYIPIRFAELKDCELIENIEGYDYWDDDFIEEENL